MRVVSNLIGVRRERHVAVELKVGRDRLTDDQERFSGGGVRPMVSGLRRAT